MSCIGLLFAFYDSFEGCKSLYTSPLRCAPYGLWNEDYSRHNLHYVIMGGGSFENKNVSPYIAPNCAFYNVDHFRHVQMLLIQNGRHNSFITLDRHCRRRCSFVFVINRHVELTLEQFQATRSVARFLCNSWTFRVVYEHAPTSAAHTRGAR